MLTLLIALVSACEPDHTAVRGMTLSTPTYGREWGSDAMPETMRILSETGVNWVSYHPYARIGRDGSVRADIDVDNPPAWLLRPIVDAQAQGLCVMVKPHLAHWGSGFGWRGDIRFDDAQAEERFHREYREWIVAVARLTASADAFVVGTELDGTVGNEEEWRKTIAAVRTVFPGHLTFASNWDAYDRIPFWDALDAIGIQAYFPLHIADEPASEDAIREAWTRVLQPVHALSAATGKPVVFTELGYDRTPTALIEPWRGGNGDEALQALALSTSLDVIAHDEVVRGAFLWKWFPGQVQRGDFRMSRPEVRLLLQESWARQHP